MRTVGLKIGLGAVLSFGLAAAAQAAPGPAGPSAVAPVTPIAAPKDRPYAGEIQLKVDVDGMGACTQVRQAKREHIHRVALPSHGRAVGADANTGEPIDRAFGRVSAGQPFRIHKYGVGTDAA